MENIFQEIKDSIGDSLDVVNTNYLNLDLLIGDESNVDSFSYRSKNIEILYNIYDKYKNLFDILIEKYSSVEQFCTKVESNSATWLQPITLYYPFIEDVKYYLGSSTNQTQIHTKIINWLNLAYPVSLNIEDCDAAAEYVEGQEAYIQFYLNQDNTVIDTPPEDLISDSGYCTTTEYETCVNCQRLYHGYTFCGTGQVFNCEGASIDFTSCGTVTCSFEGPYEKIKMIDDKTGSLVNSTVQVKSSITSNIKAVYENKREYTFIQAIKAKIVGCQWVFDRTIPNINFENLSADFFWCSEHQTYDDCSIKKKITPKVQTTAN